MAEVPLPRPIYFGLASDANQADLIGDGWLDELDSVELLTSLDRFAIRNAVTSGSGTARYRFPPVSSDALTVGLLIRNQGTGIADDLLLFENGSLGEMLRVARTAAGFIQVLNSTDVILTSTKRVLSPWAFVEVSVLFNSAGTVDLAMNGVPDGSASGADTLFDAGPCEYVHLALPRTAGGAILLADGYIREGSGPGAFLGPLQWFDMKPNADGSPQDFEPSESAGGYLMLNEAQEDRDTTFVQSTAADSVSRFTLAAAGLSAAPDFVYDYAFARLAMSGSDRIILRAISGSSTDASDPLDLSPAAWVALGWPHEVDPATGHAWDPSALASSEIEIEHDSGLSS